MRAIKVHSWHFTRAVFCFKSEFRAIWFGSVHIWRQQDFGKFYPPPRFSNCQHWETPLMTSAFASPPFQSDISFSKNPLHSTLIETLNVYLIQLKTERLGEYINAVVSRIVIGPLDLKQFLPKLKYFCWRQQGLDPSPLSTTVIILKPLPLRCWRVICERSLWLFWLWNLFDTVCLYWLLEFVT